MSIATDPQSALAPLKAFRWTLNGVFSSANKAPNIFWTATPKAIAIAPRANSTTSSRQDGVSSNMGPLLGSCFFFAASACKALISPVSRSGIAIFCNFLQPSEVSKAGEMQLSASFCSKLQAVRPLASADGGDQFRPLHNQRRLERDERILRIYELYIRTM